MCFKCGLICEDSDFIVITTIVPENSDDSI